MRIITTGTIQGGAAGFVDAIDATLLQIAALPERFPVIYAPDIRSAKVRHFPYRVVFVVVGEDIDVIAVAHTRRRPTYWRRRTP